MTCGRFHMGPAVPVQVGGRPDRSRLVCMACAKHLDDAERWAYKRIWAQVEMLVAEALHFAPPAPPGVRRE